MANALKMDLSNRVVLVPSKFLPEGVQDKRFICESGFGLSPTTSGGKIYGRWMETNENGVIRGELVEGLYQDKSL